MDIEELKYMWKYGNPILIKIHGVEEKAILIDTRPLFEPAEPIVVDPGSGVYAVPVIDFDGKGPIPWPTGGM